MTTQQASAEKISELRCLVGKFSQDEIARKLGEYSEANIKFHQAIIGLGNCALIVEITNGLFCQMHTGNKEPDHVQMGRCNERNSQELFHSPMLSFRINKGLALRTMHTNANSQFNRQSEGRGDVSMC